MHNGKYSTDEFGRISDIDELRHFVHGIANYLATLASDPVTGIAYGEASRIAMGMLAFAAHASVCKEETQTHIWKLLPAPGDNEVSEVLYDDGGTIICRLSDAQQS